MTTASAATATPRNAMLHQAIPEDIPFIKSMVDAAYSIYVERIGRPPAPMCEDWEETIKSHNVLVLKDNDQVVGSITFHVEEESDSLKIDNLVVHPAIQGRGYGRFLIDHAESEARRCALRDWDFPRQRDEWKMDSSGYTSTRNLFSKPVCLCLNHRRSYLHTFLPQGLWVNDRKIPSTCWLCNGKIQQCFKFIILRGKIFSQKLLCLAP